MQVLVDDDERPLRARQLGQVAGGPRDEVRVQVIRVGDDFYLVEGQSHGNGGAYQYSLARS